jgi:pyrroloquinoline quinone biosynthesis protein D
MEPAPTDIPSFKKGCRISTSSEPLLLIPEGALRLQGPGKRVLELCDGKRNLGDVIRQLQVEYPSAEASRISGEVIAFLKGLQDKGAIEFL